MSSESLTPRAQRKREQIRVAAQRLFLRHGFTNTSMDAITAEAGISKQTLYSYYPRKEDLFADVLSHITLENPALRWMLEEVPVPENVDELRATLTNLAHEVVQRLLQPEFVALIRIIIAEVPRFPHLGQLFKSSVPERAMIYLVTFLKQAQERGIVRAELDPEAAVRMLVGSLFTYLLLNGLFLNEEVPEVPSIERIKAIIDTLMPAIVRAYKGEGRVV